MRRETSTVVAMVGEVADALLAEVGRSPNIALARPPADEPDPLAAASAALRQAARNPAPFVLAPADPLAAVAGAWQAMWTVAEGPPGVAEFEERADQALAAWRAKRFELPDYYLVITRAAGGVVAGPGAADGGPPDAGEVPPDLYLGPLRAARPQRVSPVVISDGAAVADVGEQAARVLHALRNLSHGPWWPPLDELIDAIRSHYPGSLAASSPDRATSLAERAR